MPPRRCRSFARSWPTSPTGRWSWCRSGFRPTWYRGLANDQPTYDLTSVLYAVRPDRGYFDLSPPGRILVEDDGVTRFVLDRDGPHRYLMVRPEQIVRVREAQAMLCSQPPG